MRLLSQEELLALPDGTELICFHTPSEYRVKQGFRILDDINCERCNLYLGPVQRYLRSKQMTYIEEAISRMTQARYRVNETCM
jgi:hypothetical protein